MAHHQLRTRKSIRLESLELLKVDEARTAFEKLEGDGPGKHDFTDRSKWPQYQEMIGQLAEAHKSMGGDQGELENEVDRALARYKKLVEVILGSLKKHVSEPSEEAFLEETFVHPSLKGCVFVGHVATDLDSIAGAIGAAELFGGTAAKSEAELNGEIAYALKEVAHLDEPPLFDDLPGCAAPDENGEWKRICLVDHNEEKQMVKSLREDKNRKKRIVGLIDHHAVAESFSSETPLLIDVRPWGSMSSVVAHLYIRCSAHMKPEVARLLMCAILSDTLNLQSVTTTDADRFAVALLAMVGGVEDPDEVARLMFRAKTGWIVNLGPYAMVRGDQKDFTADGWKYGIAVLEVTDTEPVLQVAGPLTLELRTLKIEKGGGVLANQLDFAFLFVVDIIKQRSYMLVIGGREYALAKEAFPGCPFRRANDTLEAPGKTISAEQTLCDVGPLVSRKAQFVPAVAKVLNAGFTCHKKRVSDPDYKCSHEDTELEGMMMRAETNIFVDDNQKYARRNTRRAMSVIFKEGLE